MKSPFYIRLFMKKRFEAIASQKESVSKGVEDVEVSC